MKAPMPGSAAAGAVSPPTRSTGQDAGMEIKRAQTDEEIAEVRRLFRAYETSLGVDLAFQGFEQELTSLPGKYAPPNGDLLVGLVKDRILGCVAVRRLALDICEMKRLYVRSEGRGTGMGRRLAQQAIGAARSLGYASMRLDTLDRLTAAMRLYESLGFRRIDPYYDNPLPGVVYWELDLKTVRAPRAAGALRAPKPAALSGSSSDTKK